MSWGGGGGGGAGGKRKAFPDYSYTFPGALLELGCLLLAYKK